MEISRRHGERVYRSIPQNPCAFLAGLCQPLCTPKE
nr:MAG TPA: hypothetical protein [Caudoviricetes sp.]